MARKVFYSFHYKQDSHRVSQVRNIGTVEKTTPLLTGNQWEEIKRKGDSAIQNWIDGQISGKSCTVVLIGQYTASRRWVNYEIEKSWFDGKAVLGVYIHRLKDLGGRESGQGNNPFDNFTLNSRSLASVVKAYNPSGWDSKAVYANIANNLADWVEEAISIRSRNQGVLKYR
ncbi:TIR domain-containing protein [Micromonospora sp. NPDC001898]|uniref:TIR domain-containing protein n=1 Tax=Micromonospora sp. NPDC001898 TaxID=3364221 RepID=UPI0036CC2997